MRNLLYILVLISSSCIGQVHDYNLRIDSPKTTDSTYCLLTATTGSNFAGRGQFKSLPQLATLLSPFLTVTETQGIDDVLNQAQALTTGRSINLSGNEFQLLQAGNPVFYTDGSPFSIVLGDQGASQSLFNIGTNSANFTNPNSLDATFGINNTAPTEALDVVGDGLFSGTISASNLSGTNTGDQDLSGYATLGTTSTFTADPIVPAEAYAVGWNGSNEVPTKNDVYDKIETLGGTAAPTTISPSQITSDQDNYHPTGMGKSTYVRISGDNGIRAITGIEDSTAGTLQKIIFNIGSYPIYFPMDHPDSDAAHRFTGNSGDYILYPGMSVTIWYDLTSTKWRITCEMNTENKTGQFYRWAAGSTTDGDYGDLGFLSLGGTRVTTTSTTTIPSCALLGTSTSSTGGFSMCFTKTSSTFSAFESAHNYTESLISIPVLSTAGQTFTVELQIMNDPANSVNLEDNNLIGIRYSHGINSGKFELFSQDNAAAESVADLGITVVAGTLYKLRIEIDKTKTEARAYINGVYVGRVTGNLPDSVVCGARVLILKSVGSTATKLAVHNFSAGAIYP